MAVDLGTDRGDGSFIGRPFVWVLGVAAISARGLKRLASVVCYGEIWSVCRCHRAHPSTEKTYTLGSGISGFEPGIPPVPVSRKRRVPDPPESESTANHGHDEDRPSGDDTRRDSRRLHRAADHIPAGRVSYRKSARVPETAGPFLAGHASSSGWSAGSR